MSGRSPYTPEIVTEICERLAAGESLAAICRDAHMPTRKTVHEWIDDNREGFGDRYARAREAQAEYWAGEIIEISDSVRGSQNAAEVQAAKLMVESRKWTAVKMLPKRYGEKVDVTGHVTLEQLVTASFAVKATDES